MPLDVCWYHQEVGDYGPGPLEPLSLILNLGFTVEDLIRYGVDEREAIWVWRSVYAMALRQNDVAPGGGIGIKGYRYDTCSSVRQIDAHHLLIIGEQHYEYVFPNGHIYSGTRTAHFVVGAADCACDPCTYRRLSLARADFLFLMRKRQRQCFDLSVKGT